MSDKIEKLQIVHDTINEFLTTASSDELLGACAYGILHILNNITPEENIPTDELINEAKKFAIKHLEVYAQFGELLSEHNNLKN